MGVDMPREGLRPTIVTYASAINAAAKAKNAEAALQLLRPSLDLCLDPESSGIDNDSCEVHSFDNASSSIEILFSTALEACMRDPSATVGSAVGGAVVDLMSDYSVTGPSRGRI